MSQSRRQRVRNQQAKDLDWAETLQSALDEMMRPPNKKGMVAPQLRVLAISPTGARIEVEMRFLAGKRYCCCEPGCHLPTFSREWWRCLREALRNSTEREPPPMEMTLFGVIEEGALFSLTNHSRGSRAFSYEDGPWRERDAIG